MDPVQFKQRQRAMWSVGDFPDIARTIEPASHALLEAVGVSAGDRLLDVAAGTGNLAIPAARAGARVTGLDLTPELFEVAHRRAAQAGVEVEWIEGDAKDLPFPDGSFDRVTSAMAKRALEPQGRWSALRTELVQLYEDSNEADDGTLRTEAEYLLTVGRLPG